MEVFKREGHEGATYFVGAEVEYTPAHGKRTLFVVGKQPVDEIVKNARENGVTHIFMGANHYFEASAQCDDTYWNEAIGALLERGFWVSLEYQAHEHGIALKMFDDKVWKSRYFIPLLSVRIPHVQTSNHNLTIKIDDVNFKATNDGVWCMHHSEATDSNRFTSWSEYGDDKIVGQAVSAPVEKKTVTVTEPKKEEPVAEPKVSEVINDNSVGLDQEAKPEIVEETEKVTTADAVEAYAEAAPKSKKAKKE